MDLSNFRTLFFCVVLCCIPLISNAGTYKYIDADGVAHYVDDENKIPERYQQNRESLQLEQRTLTDEEKNRLDRDLNRWRQQLLDSSGQPNPRRRQGSQVAISGNNVLVPVILGYRDREISTVLVLDTGASITVLEKTIGSRLGMKHIGRTKAILADGSTIFAPLVRLEYLIVGGFKVNNVIASLIDSKTQRNDSGLLGMNILRNFNYSIDFDRQTMRWQPK